MKNTVIIETKKVGKLKNPVLIEGLPGIGLVGKLAADHLIDELKGKKIAELYSPSFPHQVLMQDDGIVKMIKNEIYLIKGKKRDIVILVGDVQALTSDAQYETNGLILDYFQKNLGGKFVITLGGYGSGRVLKTPKVYGAANNEKVVKKYSKIIKFGKTPGPIIGAAGLLLGLGALKGMDGLCVMGETHGGYVDPKAAKAIIKTLSKIVDISVDTKELDKRAKESEILLKKLEEMAKKEAGISESIGLKDLSYIR